MPDDCSRPPHWKHRRVLAERRQSFHVGLDTNSRREVVLHCFRESTGARAKGGNKSFYRELLWITPTLPSPLGEFHMKEFPDYYERLKRMDAEAERDWAAKKS